MPISVDMILIRGLPGAGKTTLANVFVAAGYSSFCNDDYFTDKEGRYAFDAAKQKQSQDHCFRRVKNAILANKKVVVHNCFLAYSAMARYVRLCEEQKKTYTVIIVEGDYGNVHGVPADTRERMKQGFQYIPF